MNFDDKTFVLGIGAQKAGTSWLRSYLSERSDIFFPPVELHFFDVKYGPDKHRRRRDRLLQKKRAKERWGLNTRLKLKLEHVDILRDDSSYKEFFRERVPAGIPVFGEITPSYALLGEDGFRAVRKLFSNVRLMFIMRDPVGRFYSQMRMSRNKRFLQGKDPKDIEMLMKQSSYVQASSYQFTIENLERIFSSTEIIYLFYETLFRPEAMVQLCAFLGVPYAEPKFAEVVNPGGARDPISPHIDKEVRRLFDDTYRFCREKFGNSIPSEWRLGG